MLCYPSDSLVSKLAERIIAVAKKNCRREGTKSEAKEKQEKLSY
jgi:hypothetical protein